MSHRFIPPLTICRSGILTGPGYAPISTTVWVVDMFAGVIPSDLPHQSPLQLIALADRTTSLLH
ncbi:hypothetical protein NHH03_17915 [Stieleria sp. TO1_6]|uniref:hypothetical protein n=1 Tax=Stieleria tagensis TaxID=2956795 RepID=UPI00209B7F24|nr:hypothetical protein [Stieleria tagensis]MCO8123627.1 hypothetical protein [Stieleria tagensis]